jgi:hypothetical protein
MQCGKIIVWPGRNAKDPAGIISGVKTSYRGPAIFGSALCLIMTTGCTSRQQNPDQIREKTAQATAALKTDAKAVAEGVREGLSRNQPLDLNQATKEQLKNLPGFTDARADRVIATRPYSSPQGLVSRHVLTSQQYQRVKDRVTAKN